MLASPPSSVCDIVWNWGKSQEKSKKEPDCGLTFFYLPQIIGRVDADPDDLPRTNEFGLDIDGFLQRYYSSECPPSFFPLTALCCDMESEKR